MGSRIFQYAPLAVFGLVYVLSCLVGALLLMVEYEPFVALFEYFSGTDAPQLSTAETRTNILLLVAAPLVLAAGYVLGTLVPFKRFARAAPREELRKPVRWLPALVFALLAAIGFISLVRAGAFGRTGSWLDYGAWVQSRSENFARIGFFEFVNLYVFIPIAAAWTLVSGSTASRTWMTLRWVPLPIALALSLFLFTRKAVLIALLIVVFAWAIDAVRARSRHVRRFVLGALGLAAALYIALVIVPVYAEASSTANQVASQARADTDPERAARLAEVAEDFDLGDRRKAILLYAALSPLTRSSAPALYYPVVFPRRHDYFHLDLGQDIVGIGAMPEDNVVVWNYLNPDTPGGTTTVSYQFVLFSQIGTLGAIGASLLVGFLLALAWRLSQIPIGATSPLLGSMVLLLATYLAIDSLRNSLVVSYGVIWGILFVAATTLLGRIGASRARLRPGTYRARVLMSSPTSARQSDS